MAKNHFWAVRVGKKPGIYTSWPDAEIQVKGYPCPVHQGFTTKAEALAYMEGIDWETEEQEQIVFSDDEIPEHKGSENSCDENHLHVENITDELNDFLHKYYPQREFTEEQKAAIGAIEGRNLLYAIPGSGKTAVLTARAGYMVHKGIPARNLLIMTFGKEAALHMEKVYKEVFDEFEVPHFCTIHSFCNTVLKKAEEMTDFTKPRLIVEDEDDPIPDTEAGQVVYDPDDGKEVGERNVEDKKRGIRFAGKRHPVNIISKILIELKYADENNVRPLAESVETVIGCIKNRKMSSESIAGLGKIEIAQGFGPVDIYEVYSRYTQNLQKQHPPEMDFDDMLMLADELLSKKGNNKLLEYFQNQYPYISVDETQDTSHLQHCVIKQLVGESGHLFMVGDDDQSIYAFRGAAPKEMLEFSKNYSNAQIYKMGCNFRSDSSIIEASDLLIRRNKGSRAEKNMVPFSKVPGEIRVLDISHSMQSRYLLDQANRLIGRNKEKRKEWEKTHDAATEKFEPETMAVLYRTNVSALVLLAYYFKYNIPFKSNKIFDILNILYSRTANNLLSLLTFSIKPDSFENYKHAYYVFNNYKGLFVNKETAIEQVWNLYAEHQGEPILPYLARVLENKDAEKARHLLEVQGILQTIREQNDPYNALKMIMVDLCYNKNNGVKGKSSQMLIQALLEIASMYNSIDEFLEAIKTMKAKTEWDKNKGNEVILSTMHSAKGQEYDTVYIIDATDETIPGNGTKSPLPFWYDNWPEQINEERRLFYVAATRAKHKLEILVDGYNGAGPSQPSRFIREYLDGYGSITVENASAEYARAAEDINIDQLLGIKYFAVRHGKTPGIYTNEDDAHTRGNPGTIWCTRETYMDAFRFINKNISFNRDTLSRMMDSNPDIPDSISASILSLFQASSVDDLDDTVKQSIGYKMDHIYRSDQNGQKIADYSLSANEYALLYLPVNMQKVWQPLWQMLEAETLPIKDESMNPQPIRILELGAGPGTTTLGIVSFYSELAKSNPSINISVSYTVAEREEAFIEVFHRLVDMYIKIKPVNLEFSINVIQRDARKYLQQCKDACFDLIVESNMINPYETIKKEDLPGLLNDLAQALEFSGKGILIEPAEEESMVFFDEVIRLSKKNTMFLTDERHNCFVALDNNSLYQALCDKGIRKKRDSRHYFCYAILKRN